MKRIFIFLLLGSLFSCGTINYSNSNNLDLYTTNIYYNIGNNELGNILIVIGSDIYNQYFSFLENYNFAENVANAYLMNENTISTFSKYNYSGVDYRYYVFILDDPNNIDYMSTFVEDIYFEKAVFLFYFQNNSFIINEIPLLPDKINELSNYNNFNEGSNIIFIPLEFKSNYLENLLFEKINLPIISSSTTVNLEIDNEDKINFFGKWFEF